MQQETIYLSFLGAHKYAECNYQWNNQQATPTAYVQIAELELLLKQAQSSISKVLILGTKTSEETHWGALEKELKRLQKQYDIKTPEGQEWYSFKHISEDLSTQNQWSDFQKILSYLPSKVNLIVDMTHGFRSVPIVFSSAMQFLRVTKNLSLKHVFYGSFSPKLHAENPNTIFDIIDYVEFYSIHEWTDAVSRLIENADARKLSEVSQQNIPLSIQTFLEKVELSTALIALTEAIRNVKVNFVEQRAQKALELVSQAQRVAQKNQDYLGELLLQAIQDKFITLIQTPPSDDQYNKSYLDIQITLANLLLKHDLNMQAFTALSELIPSIGLCYYEYEKEILISGNNHSGKRLGSYVFPVMISNEEKDWDFKEDYEIHVTRLRKLYDWLKQTPLPNTEHHFLKELADCKKQIDRIRNDFNHAWTRKRSEQTLDFRTVGEDLCKRLNNIIENLPDTEQLFHPPKQLETAPELAPKDEITLETEREAELEIFEERKKELRKILEDIALKAPENLDLLEERSLFTEKELESIKQRGAQARTELKNIAEKLQTEAFANSERLRKRFRQNYPQYQDKLDELIEENHFRYNERRKAKNFLYSALTQEAASKFISEQEILFLQYGGEEYILRAIKRDAEKLRKELAPLKGDKLSMKEKEKHAQKLKKKFHHFSYGISKYWKELKQRQERKEAEAYRCKLPKATLPPITKLEPEEEWTLVIDETGGRFNRAETEGQIGKFIGILIPTKTEDKGLFAHATTSTDKKRDEIIHHIITQKNWSIFGIGLLDIPLVLGEQWLDGNAELISWILRLLPAQKTTLNVCIEQRNDVTSKTDMEQLKRMLLLNLSRASAERAKNITLKISVYTKTGHSWLAYADFIACMWAKGTRHSKDALKRSRLQGQYLHSGIKPHHRQYLDTVLNGKGLSGAKWTELLSDNPHSTNLPILILEEWKRQGVTPAQWTELRKEAEHHLNQKRISMHLLSQQIRWLKETMPADIIFSPKEELLWQTVLLQERNHRGENLGKEEIKAYQEQGKALYDEDIRLVCFLDLNLAVQATHSFEFQAASELLQKWEKMDTHILGLNYKGRVLSSLGQHQAFQHNYTKATEYFNQAIEQFKALSSEKERADETEHTGAYRSINMIDDPNFSDDQVYQHLMNELGIKEESGFNLIQHINTQLNKYQHHLLLRALIFRENKELSARYLHAQKKWIDDEGYPWCWIHTYRAILLKRVGEHQLASEALQKAFSDLEKPAGIMRVIFLVIHQLSRQFQIKGAPAIDLSRELNAFEAEYQNKVAYRSLVCNTMQALQKKPAKDLSWVQQLLPFNFH